MKYIFITFEGLALPIAYKLQQEGHDVIVGQIEDIKDYVPEEEAGKAHESDEEKEKRLSQYKNMLNFRNAHDVVKMMEETRNPHDFFVFLDVNNLYRWADKVRHLGFEGNFPTKEDFLLEVDREDAKKFVAKHYPKLHTPDIREFTKAEDAIKFLQNTSDSWVLKGKDSGAKTYVPDVNDVELARQQITEMLSNFTEKYEKRGFILEMLIPSLIELTSEKMYYDGVPLVTSVDIENKSIGSGNISVQTGCAQDFVFPTHFKDRINQLAFPPIVDDMARNHKGLFIWDASLLVNKKDGKIYFGEFCSNRPGYNSIFTEICQSPTINGFFENLVHKKPPLPPGTVATSVRIFNMNRDPNEQVSGDILIDYKPEIEKDLWLWDVKKNSRGKLTNIGIDWNLAVITGSGKSVDEAVNKMYRNVDGFSFVGAYYRSKDDYLSLDYSSSILNRLNYGLERGLYSLPFDVKVGSPII